MIVDFLAIVLIVMFFGCLQLTGSLSQPSLIGIVLSATLFLTEIFCPGIRWISVHYFGMPHFLSLGISLLTLRFALPFSDSDWNEPHRSPTHSRRIKESARTRQIGQSDDLVLFELAPVCAAPSRCLVCASEVQRHVVICSGCHTPYHADCWRYNQSRCGRYGCDSESCLKQ